MSRPDKGPHSVTDPDEIERRLASELSSRQEVLLAYLFGSQATRQTHPRSDVDVAVWLREPYDRSALSPLVDVISAATGALKRDDLDVVILNEAPLWLAARILQGRLLVERDQAHRVRIESAIMARYHDRLPYFRRHLEEAGKRLAERGFG